MSQLEDVTIRLEALDGTWETCGVDRARGLTPENVIASANGWGSDQASFDLRRDPKSIWPDISAFSPVKIESGGTLVWSGRVKETPSRDGTDRVMSVQCEGWQYHLDDDVYHPFYVHDKVSEWRDVRTFLTADLATFVASPQISADNGIAVLAWAKGSVVVNLRAAGIALDLGVSLVGQRIVVEWEAVNGSGNGNQLIEVETYTDGVGGTGSGAVSATVATGSSSGTLRATINSRYLAVVLRSIAGGDFTAADDLTVRITAIRVFASTSYESSDRSTLKATQVISDALSKGTMLLSSDRSQIDPGATVTFAIPSMAPGEPRTPREMWEASNAYHDYRSKIDVQARPVFGPQPSRPKYTVGAASAMEFEDASANSGAEIFSRVIVTAQSPEGDALKVPRTMFDQGPVLAAPDGDETIPNPTFDTNTSGWSVGPAYNSVGTATFARDTTTFDTTPASGRMTYTLTPANAEAIVASHTLSGTFKQGLIYSISMRLKSGSTVFPVGLLRIAFGDVDLVTNAPGAQTNCVLGGGQIIAGAFTTYSLVWAPERDFTNPNLQVNWIGGHTLNDNLWIDSLRLERSYSTLVERRGFRRSKILQVRSTLPSDEVAAAKIGDVWLAGHRFTPFKGTVKLTGGRAVANRMTGAPVPLSRLLLDTGELLHFADRPDPDTGGHGRNGRMTQIQVDFAKNEATVTLDNSRAGFEALLERLAVVTGGS